MVRLLDVEPELANRLREDDRAEAHERLRLRTEIVPAGAWTLVDEGTRLHPLGLVVVDGVLLQEVRIGTRESLQLLGRGDVVLPRAPPGESLDAEMRWVAATDTCVAILDDRLQQPFALWPGLALGLLDRVAQQLARLAVQNAIAQLPRVEDRLEATFWDLADRWGHVTRSGIHVPLRLTHEVLARLVGGRRPTISLALAALAERQILRRDADGSWLLLGERPSMTAGRAPAAAGARAVSRTAPPIVEPSHEPWLPAARRELLAAAQRAAEDHTRAAARVAADRERYEQTRAHSRALREQAARTRRAQDPERDLLTSRDRAKPSAG
jgi:CRP/FNR family cyclic AMP-dependent transcriptional regulator